MLRARVGESSRRQTATIYVISTVLYVVRLFRLARTALRICTDSSRCCTALSFRKWCGKEFLKANRNMRVVYRSVATRSSVGTNVSASIRTAQSHILDITYAITCKNVKALTKDQPILSRALASPVTLLYLLSFLLHQHHAPQTCPPAC